MALSIAHQSQSTDTTLGGEVIITPTTGNWLVAVLTVKFVTGLVPQICVGDWARNMWTQVYSGLTAASASNSSAQIYTQVWVAPNIQYSGWSNLGVYAYYLYSPGLDTASACLNVIEVAGMGNGFLTVDSVTVSTASATTTRSITLPAPSGGANCLMIGCAGTDNASGTVSVTSAGWTSLTQVTNSNPNDTLTSAWRETTATQTISWSSTVSTNWAAVAVAIRTTGVAPSQPNSKWPAVEFQLGFGQNLSTPITAVQWTTLPNRLMEWDTQRGIQYELGFVQSSPTDMTIRNDDGAFTPRTGGTGTATANGTTTTLIVSNTDGATMTVGDFFQLKTSGGVLKEINVFQITSIVAASSTTVTFIRADGTGGGAIASTATNDIYSACPINIYLPFRILATWNGVKYPVTVGWVERWPQSWDSPHWGNVQAVGIDVIATLTAADLGILRGEILAKTPHSYWPCDDSSGLTTGQNIGYDASRKPIVSTSSSNGVGANGGASFGATTQSKQNSGTLFPFLAYTSLLGDTGTGWNSNGMTGAEIHTKGSALVVAPGNDSTFPSVTNGVTVVCAWNPTDNDITTISGGTGSVTLCCMRSSVGTGAAATLLAYQVVCSTGHQTITVWDKTTHVSTTTDLNELGIQEARFNLWAISITPTTWRIYNNSFTNIAPQTHSGTANLPATWGLLDIMGEADSTTSANFVPGTACHVAIFPRVLTSDEVHTMGYAALDGVWFNFGSDTVGLDGAINRKLYYAGWNGARVLNRSSYTVGNDLPLASSVAEKIAQLADTQPGMLFSDATGTLQFRDIDRVGTSQVTKATIGDRPDLSEIPYVGDDGGIIYDYDPTYIYNSVNVTNVGFQSPSLPTSSNGPQTSTVNARTQSSITKYGLRTLERTVTWDNLNDVNNSAVNLLGRYDTPRLRVEGVKIDVVATQSWAFALSVEVGDLVTVNRRPIGAPTISVACTVLNIIHNVNSPNQWDLQLVLAPLP